MSRMFCTLQEAAETLQASEDQVQTLVEQGLLHEFREGSHRLVKASEVGTLARLQRRRPKMRRPNRTTRAAAPRRARPKVSRPAGPEAPDGPAAVARVSRPPSGADHGPKNRETGPGAKDRARRSEPSSRTCPARSAARGAPPRTLGDGFDSRSSDPSSVRDWFWMGLVQDRPVAIAILAGLVLLLLSALAAGLGLLAEPILR